MFKEFLKKTLQTLKEAVALYFTAAPKALSAFWQKLRYVVCYAVPSIIRYRLRRCYQHLRVIRKLGVLACLKGWWKFRQLDQQWREVDFRLQRLSGQYKRGRLEAYAETGTEGFIWAVYEDGKSGYDALNCLVPGDLLIIFAHDGKILFNDIIDPDYEAGYQPYPLNPEFGQPSALGCWIHWTQKGWKPDDWAALFFERPVYRAILVKAEPKARVEESED